jgi:hypothetical protein
MLFGKEKTKQYLAGTISLTIYEKKHTMMND